jgi:hypothetical protein
MATGGDDFQSALIDNFMAVTGADAERASFFLQSAAWNLQVPFLGFNTCKKFFIHHIFALSPLYFLILV